MSMRIRIRSACNVLHPGSHAPVRERSVLARVSGWRYADLLDRHLDTGLGDLGVVGGIVQADYSSSRGLELVVDFWAPRPLSEAEIQSLYDFTRGQFTDGAGEAGFDAEVENAKLLIVADTEAPFLIEQSEDETRVPLPSRVARAARDGDLQGVRDAIESGESVDSALQGSTGLHFAILFGKPEGAFLLLSLGADPNVPDAFGDTPLHLCALSRDLSDSDSALLASELLRRGANASALSRDGQSAEFLAEYRGKLAMARVLRGVRSGRKGDFSDWNGSAGS